jgi:ABC-type transport system involved in cytochrome c biogenesis permease subunit
MMKLLSLVFALIMLGAVSASAQVLSFGIGADVTFPTAELQDNVATGYGGTALAKFGLLPIVDLTGGVEYIKFTDKSITVDNLTEEGSGSAFGILVGGRLNFLVVGYVGLETGTYSFTKKVAGDEEKITRGFVAPLAGVKLGMFDLGARYVSAGDDSFWGLRGMIWF